jgi:hypothetical protein
MVVGCVFCIIIRVFVIMIIIAAAAAAAIIIVAVVDYILRVVF